jgi:hypothetical protein
MQFCLWLCCIWLGSFVYVCIYICFVQNLLFAHDNCSLKYSQHNWNRKIVLILCDKYVNSWNEILIPQILLNFFYYYYDVNGVGSLDEYRSDLRVYMYICMYISTYIHKYTDICWLRYWSSRLSPSFLQWLWCEWEE